MIFFGFASEKHVGYFIQVLVLLFNQTSKHNMNFGVVWLAEFIFIW